MYRRITYPPSYTPHRPAPRTDVSYAIQLPTKRTKHYSNTHFFNASTAFTATSLPKHITSTLNSSTSSNSPTFPICNRRSALGAYTYEHLQSYVGIRRIAWLKLPRSSTCEAYICIAARTWVASCAGGENGGFTGCESIWWDEEEQLELLNWCCHVGV